MNFEECLKQGSVKKLPVDRFRSKSLIKSGLEAIKTAKRIKLQEKTSKTILREIYEGFREYIEATGFLKGYKFLDHLSITYFLKDILKEKRIAYFFDRYRKIRNGINYYRNDLNLETVNELLTNIDLIRKKLEKHTKL